MSSDRRIVLWYGLGIPTPFQEELCRRDLSPEPISAAAALEEWFSQSRALVIDARGKLGRARTILSEHARAALNHGLFVGVLVSDQSEETTVLSIVGRQFPVAAARSKIVVRRWEPYRLAELIARHQSEFGENPSVRIQLLSASTLEIIGPDDARIDSLRQLFLRRAFCDCEQITVRSLVGGFSAFVVEVDAVRRLAGFERSVSYFAKEDTLGKIQQERENYDQFVEGFLPYHQRPRLDSRRFVSGADRGLIVGDFVDCAEPLVDALRRNVIDVPISSLFGSLLRTWKLRGYVDAIPPCRPIVETENDPIRRSDFQASCSARISVATSTFGARPPEELERDVRSVMLRRHRQGPIHGDLHANNVRVRTGEAVLIDFERTRLGPLLQDPATLEVSLGFWTYGVDVDQFDTQTLELQQRGWRELIDKLYDPQYFSTAIPPAIERSPREWMWSSIRVLRNMALAEESTPDEYRLLVALQLLRRARLEAVQADDFRYVYAYVVADRLLQGCR